MKRNPLLQDSSDAQSVLNPAFVATPTEFPTVRIPANRRKFQSEAIEKAIADFKVSVEDEELGWLFENCFPNTLDTTVTFEM